MIISDFYQTKIEASSYNVNIDSTNTVITVSLIDFNGAAVTGKSVTLTVDRGYFNKNGSTAISGTTTKSITATTDSNGKITATYTASEWGLATFSTNTTNTQINVKGWKVINTYASGKITLMSDGLLGKIYIDGTFTASTNTSTKLATIDDNYQSDNFYSTIYNPYSSANYHIFIAGSDVVLYNSQSSVSIKNTIIYRLASPRY